MILKNQNSVINIGVNLFAEEMFNQGLKVVHVNWKPPAEGDSKVADILKRLAYGTKGGNQ